MLLLVAYYKYNQEKGFTMKNYFLLFLLFGLFSCTQPSSLLKITDNAKLINVSFFNTRIPEIQDLRDAVLDQKTKKLVDDELLKLPRNIQSFLKAVDVKIVFVKGLQSSAITVWDKKSNGTKIYWILMHESVLNKNADSWLTEKEATCFKKQSDYLLSLKTQNADISAFTCLLIHEIGHVVDYEYHYTPFVDLYSNESVDYDKIFTKNIWRDYYEYNADTVFPYHYNISFYGLAGGSRITIEEASFVYEALLKSPFVSLYGTMNWAEDFAEYFTWYYLRNNYNCNFQVELKNKDVVVKTFYPLETVKVKARMHDLRIILGKNKL